MRTSDQRAVDMLGEFSRGMLDFDTLVIALRSSDWTDGESPADRSDDLGVAWMEAGDLQSSGGGGNLATALGIAFDRDLISAQDRTRIYQAVTGG